MASHAIVLEVNTMFNLNFIHFLLDLTTTQLFCNNEAFFGPGLAIPACTVSHEGLMGSG